MKKKTKKATKPKKMVAATVAVPAPLGAYVDLLKLVDTCSAMARSSHDASDAVYRKPDRTPQENILAIMLMRIAVDCDHVARLAHDLAPKPKYTLAT